MKEILFFVVFSISLFILLSSLLDAQNQKENFKQIVEGLTNNSDVTFGGNMTVNSYIQANGNVDNGPLGPGKIQIGKWADRPAVWANDTANNLILHNDGNKTVQIGASTNYPGNLVVTGNLKIGNKAIIYGGADPFTNDGWVRLMAGDGAARWGGYNAPAANGTPAGAAGFGANSFFANMNYYFNNQQPIGSSIPDNMFIMYGSANQIRFGWSGVDAVTIDAAKNLFVGGNVTVNSGLRINNTNGNGLPAAAKNCFDLYGWGDSLNFGWSGYNAMTLDKAAKLTVNGNVSAFTFIQTSDLRLKTNIEPLTNVISSIKQLNGVKFNFKTKSSDKKSIGLIAQDVEKVFPELVMTDDTDDKIKSVSYTNMVGVLVEAVKEQQKMIEDQQKMINDLQETVKMLVSRLR